MKIGYYVQGSTDEAVVHGLARRWCPDAQLAPGKFRGSSRQSFRREIENALVDLRDDKLCDVIIVLTDSDGNALAQTIRCNASDLAVSDPKGAVENGFGYGRGDLADVKQRIMEYVRKGPIGAWIRNGESFADFYDDVRALAARTGCDVPNERERRG